MKTFEQRISQADEMTRIRILRDFDSIHAYESEPKRQMMWRKLQARLFTDSQWRDYIADVD
jgi:hypothetical protein